MQDYNFWADLLATFKSSPDWIKALWLLVPPVFVLALIAIILRFGLALRRRQSIERDMIPPLIYGNGGLLEPCGHFRLSEHDDALLVIPPTPLCPVTHFIDKGTGSTG